MPFVIQGEYCGGRCASTEGCTNFVWTRENGGTCFLKNGGAKKRDAVPLLNSPGSVCGFPTDTDGVRVSISLIPINDYSYLLARSTHFTTNKERVSGYGFDLMVQL